MSEDSVKIQHIIIVFGSLLSIGLVIFLNDEIIWNLLKDVWLKSGIFCQSLWDKFLNQVSKDEYKLFVYGTTLWSLGLYWGIGLIYTFMDVFNKPQWIRKYKVQVGENQPVDSGRLFKAMGEVLFNQLCVGLPFTMIGYALKPKMGDSLYTLPSFSRVVYEFIIFYLVEEAAFYYSHRLLHHRSLYKHIHKKHHEWTAPIAITAVYCHPLEYLFGNILPVALGPTLMKSHILVSWLWYGRTTFRTLNNHSGYHLPGFISPEFHDYHHLKFNECYGLLGIFDYLHGSDMNFRLSKSFKRHIASFNLKSVRDQFPDEILN